MRSQMNKNRAMGFSLVEILMAVGLTSVIGLVIASLMTNFFRSQSLLNAQQDMFQASNLVEGVLSNATACAADILDAGSLPVTYNGATANVAFLKDSPGSTLLAVGTNYSPRLKINSMQLVPTGIPKQVIVVPAGTVTPAPGTYSQWLVNFVINGVPTSGIGSVSSKVLPFTVYTDAANRIAYCLIQMPASQTCTSLTMSFNPITQSCQLNACNAGSVTPGYDCFNPPLSTCVGRIYYWGYTGTGSSATPICVCSQSCSALPSY